MLRELRIRNFATIEEATLGFGPGLNVLSGETGAGKTIIMTAAGLLLGGRASPELIRTGTKEAVVEGIFVLEGEALPAEMPEWLDSENPRDLVVRRVIAEGGRSRISINDNTATVQGLARLGAMLVQIYGQHEQQTLLLRENHQQILDRHAGLDQDLVEYREVYDRAREISGRLVDLERRERERSDLLELARFRASEIERTQPVAGEDEDLLAERTILANATRLAAAATAAEQALYGGDAAAIDVVSQAHAQLTEAATLDRKLEEPLEMMAAARANLEEAAYTLRAYAARIEADPTRLELVENRLQDLGRLKRKYGGTLEAAIEALVLARKEIAELEAVSESRVETQEDLRRILDDLSGQARKLHTRRERGGAELKRRMEAELRTLGMRNALFEARLGQLAAAEAEFVCNGYALGSAGSDTVEFQLSPNLGQPPLPLAKIASGGELSRVMLALKRLEAQRRGVATMIFDEVDAGIGGAVAEIVGRKLNQLARFHQVLCVTHLAQIAAFADSHFVVEKIERRGVTRSKVVALKSADRPAEIARMLGGTESSEKFLRAARELLDRSRS
jgi:DNA repair protein RecN (Recombination protein N)